MPSKLIGRRAGLAGRFARVRAYSKGTRASEYPLTSACNIRCTGCWFFEYLCVGEGLEPHRISVAESIEVRHFRAVGEGAEALVDAVVRQVLGHRVWFDVRAGVKGVAVGACSHVRAVVPRRLLVRAALRASGFPSP
jgi:hypothetical protein